MRSDRTAQFQTSLGNIWDCARIYNFIFFFYIFFSMVGRNYFTEFKFTEPISCRTLLPPTAISMRLLVNPCALILVHLIHSLTHKTLPPTSSDAVMSLPSPRRSFVLTSFRQVVGFLSKNCLWLKVGSRMVEGGNVHGPRSVNAEESA